MDGFIKNKEECLIVLPSIHKIDGEMVNKSLVLPITYKMAY